MLNRIRGKTDVEVIRTAKGEALYIEPDVTMEQIDAIPSSVTRYLVSEPLPPEIEQALKNKPGVTVKVEKTTSTSKDNPLSFIITETLKILAPSDSALESTVETINDQASPSSISSIPSIETPSPKDDLPSFMVGESPEILRENQQKLLEKLNKQGVIIRALWEAWDKSNKYAVALENELRVVKNKNQALQQQLNDSASQQPEKSNLRRHSLLSDHSETEQALPDNKKRRRFDLPSPINL